MATCDVVCDVYFICILSCFCQQANTTTTKPFSHLFLCCSSSTKAKKNIIKLYMLLCWQQCPLVHSRCRNSSLTFVFFVVVGFCSLFPIFPARHICCYCFLYIFVFAYYFSILIYFSCSFFLLILAVKFWLLVRLLEQIVTAPHNHFVRFNTKFYAFFSFFCCLTMRLVIFHQCKLKQKILLVHCAQAWVYMCVCVCVLLHHVHEDKLSVYYKLWYFMWTRA